MMENTRVGLRFVGDRVASRTRRDIAQLEPGEGAIVSSRGEKVAGFRDDGGALHAVWDAPRLPAPHRRAGG